MDKKTKKENPEEQRRIREKMIIGHLKLIIQCANICLSKFDQVNSPPRN